MRTNHYKISRMFKEVSDICSEATNDNIKAILRNDKIRYKGKGYGLISACIITFIFFYLVPIWFRDIYGYIIAWCIKGNEVFGMSWENIIELI